MLKYGDTGWYISVQSLYFRIYEVKALNWEVGKSALYPEELLISNFMDYIVESNFNLMSVIKEMIVIKNCMGKGSMIHNHNEKLIFVETKETRETYLVPEKLFFNERIYTERIKDFLTCITRLIGNRHFYDLSYGELYNINIEQHLEGFI